jgi:ATP-dependent helicase HepA
VYAADALSATVSEIELLPLPAALTDNLQTRLLEGRTDSYAVFGARHRLLAALSRYNRQVGGLRALLASRVDLHPHQAFVAGTVILDPVRRYILADEVGLGKTIEAGIILHDLLSRRPNARILILAPGSLTRQWLCEMHSSFGGQGFRLADLHPIENVDLVNWSKVICSTNFALDGLDEDLLDVPWDLVVVDEVHHLLDAPHLYRLVQALSSKARDLLLLSAVPVRRRESELYRLLALLEPQTYRAEGTSEEAFLAIYSAQEPLGRRLNLLAHDLADLEAGDASDEDVVSRLERLLSLPILSNDAQLQTMLSGAQNSPGDVGRIASEAHQIISDRYRVNRRILRNRRERLISQERLMAIQRKRVLVDFEPDQIEADAVRAAQALLADLSQSALSEDVLRPFARILLQALCDAEATLELLDSIKAASPGTINSYGREMLNAVVGMGGERWPTLVRTLSAGIKKYVDASTFAKALRAAQGWKASQSSSARLDALLRILEAEMDEGRKTLVFAGYPGVAERIASRFRERLGDFAVTEFRTDLDDTAKEESVRRFRSDPHVAIMISDESGGEGRNFQFADSLVHFDLPWQPAVIEQRIGRLDRLGRETVSTDVVSHVCINADGWEAGLYDCYNEGLDLFQTSVSGLEFALRHLQDQIVDAALSGGRDGLDDLAPKLKEIATEERVRDESEALLDEASYHAARAERFVRHPSAEVEPMLETAFLDYFRALSRGKGASRSKRAEGQQGVWVIRPDDIPHGEIAIVDKDAAGELGKRTGTFQRATAQRQRDLDFFTYGNPLFDAIVGALSQKLTGRTYAIACQAPGVAPFIGLEIVIAARPKMEGSDLSPSLLNLAEALFGTRRRPLFVPLIEGAPVDGPMLANLRSSLSLAGEGPRWRDLSIEEVQRLVRHEGGDLQECLRVANESVIPEARSVFAQELAEPLRLEVERARMQLESLSMGDAASRAEAEMLERYCVLIEGWDIVVDGIGFLAVNVRA